MKYRERGCRKESRGIGKVEVIENACGGFRETVEEKERI